jgi:hypothetical protein
MDFDHIVQRIKNMYASGFRDNEICDKLKIDGIDNKTIYDAFRNARLIGR